MNKFRDNGVFVTLIGEDTYKFEQPDRRTKSIEQIIIWLEEALESENITPEEFTEYLRAHTGG